MTLMSATNITLALLSSIGVIFAYFILTFLSKALVVMVGYWKNVGRYAKLPKHPKGNIAMQLMHLDRDWEKDVPLFEKDHKTGELYELLDMGADIMGKNVIAVLDADLIGQILSSSDPTEFPKNPVIYDQVREAFFGNGLVTTSGEMWKTHRHMLTPLFHFKSLKDMHPMMVLYTSDLLKSISDKNTSAGAAQWMNLASTLSKFTLTQIIYLAFGSTLDIDWMHEKQTRLGQLFPAHLFLHMCFGPLIKYVPFTPSWNITSIKKEVEKVMFSVIDQLRNAPQESETDGPANLLSTMLKAGKVTDREIVDEAATFLFAGFDTTSVTLSFALYYLVSHPHLMAWVQEEVDEVFGAPGSSERRTPAAEDVPNLKRCRAVINETLRLRPPGPVISRMAGRDVNLGGKYDIPAGSTVELRLFMAHRDPKYWKNPQEFMPSRWTEPNAPERHPFAFVPFSAGARNCIGKNFALQESIVALSMICSQFNIELDQTRPMEVRGTPVPQPQAWVKFHERV